MTLTTGCVCRHLKAPDTTFIYKGAYHGRAKLETMPRPVTIPPTIMVPLGDVFCLMTDQPGYGEDKKATPCVPQVPSVPWGKPAPSLKPANPKQQYGDKKPPLHLIHLIAQLHESAAMHAGRRKYGENNFLASKVELMTYIGAILRHTLAYAAGERVDQKELVHHLGAVRACCNILLTAEATGVLIDNRPETLNHPKYSKEGAMDFNAATQAAFKEVEGICEHLNTLYPNLL